MVAICSRCNLVDRCDIFLQLRPLLTCCCRAWMLSIRSCASSCSRWAISAATPPPAPPPAVATAVEVAALSIARQRCTSSGRGCNARGQPGSAAGAGRVDRQLVPKGSSWVLHYL